MKLRIALFLLILFIVECVQAVSQIHERPNIIYILADDLGYGELGVYGQEKIETPNIDALAGNGMIFTQHYSGSPVCAPSRNILLTGKHSGNAYIRSNDEWGTRGNIRSFERVVENPALEGQRPIPDSTITVGEIIQQAGYQTGIIGKWGLGAPFTEGVPTNQGFDFFFGYNGQRQAHTYYPVYLWRNDMRVALGNELVDPHQSLPEDSDPLDPESYAPFHEQPDYSAELMGQEALNFIETNSESPFFLYFATPIPHVSLQAPERWINYYRKKFGKEEPYTGDNGYVPNQYPRATYAAMISYLDEQVGAIVEKLKELNIDDNTLIIFTSDNGPTFNGGTDSEFFDSARPFLSERGRGKAYLYEGGIRVPMIAVWEKQIPAGSSTDHLSAFWDVLPTLSEIAGVPPPEEIDGISFLPALMGNDSSQEKHEYLYWEFPSYGGQQAVRLKQWKGIREDIMTDGNLEIKLYNLEEDIREENDVADRHPEVVDSIRTVMERKHSAPRLIHFEMEALGQFP